MKNWRDLLKSPRVWAYAVLSGVLLLSGLDLELLWDSFLGPFKPERLVWMIVAFAGMAIGLCIWLHRQIEDRRRKRRFVAPFLIGFALLPVSGIGAHEVRTTPRMGGGFQEAGEMLVGMVAFLGAGVMGIAFCAWVLSLVHHVRLAERTDSRDGAQLVCLASAAGLLAVSSLFSAAHVLLLAFAGRPPDLIGQIVVWVFWAAVWFLALVWLAIVVRARNAKEEWLERVRKGKVPEYEIMPLSAHPEWAQLPPYFTARSYSGVLVHKPEDQSEREPLGLVA